MEKLVSFRFVSFPGSVPGFIACPFIPLTGIVRLRALRLRMRILSAARMLCETQLGVLACRQRQETLQVKKTKTFACLL